MTDLVPSGASSAPPALSTILGVSPHQMMAYAVEISETLTRVLREKGLTKRFGQGEHVLVEGWELAGSLLGLTVDEKSVAELPCGSFEAHVTLQNPTTGRVLATASGYCGTDEPNWKSKPRYARRSMAITRAVGRVYRQNFSWLIKLAGFEPTPAEEMPEELANITPPMPPAQPAQPPPPPPTFEIYTNTDEQAKRLGALLKSQTIDEDLWEKIGTEMMGHPMTKKWVDNSIRNVLEEVSNI